MADLTEVAQWEPGIFRIETTTPVLGGEAGPANAAAKQLANRTLYLKALVDAINGNYATQAYVAAQIAALVDSSPAALDTLNELAAALGDDPAFATTMTNALAGKQPLDATLTAIAALVTSADKLVYATGPDAFATSPLTAFARTLLDDPDALTARSTLGIATASTAEAQAMTDNSKLLTPLRLAEAFLGPNSDLTTIGYQIFPGGLIVQQGNATTVGGGLSLTFPIAFPNACHQVLPVLRSGSVSPVTVSHNVPNQTGVGIYSSDTSGNGVTADFSWLAIGH